MNCDETCFRWKIVTAMMVKKNRLWSAAAGAPVSFYGGILLLLL